MNNQLYALRKAATETWLDEIAPDWRERFPGDWQEPKSFIAVVPE